MTLEEYKNLILWAQENGVTEISFEGNSAKILPKTDPVADIPEIEETNTESNDSLLYWSSN